MTEDDAIDEVLSAAHLLAHPEDAKWKSERELAESVREAYRQFEAAQEIASVKEAYGKPRERVF